MNNLAPVYITDILGEVVDKTNALLRADANSWLSIKNKNINYVYGGKNHIWQGLSEIDKMPDKSSGLSKYPLFCLNMPVGIRRGNYDGYYGEVVISSIFIATLSDNSTLPPAKYANNMKPVLFPIYYTFLTMLARHPSVVNTGGANAIQHEMWEYPADNAGVTKTSPDDNPFPDYADVLVIRNLSFTVNQQVLVSCANQISQQ